jgi:hypothetical protein
MILLLLLLLLKKIFLDDTNKIIFQVSPAACTAFLASKKVHQTYMQLGLNKLEHFSEQKSTISS